MKLRDFGVDAPREWFQQILQWSQKKIHLDENVDCVYVKANIAAVETEVGHTLGRIPRYVEEIAEYPNGTAGISFTKAPTIEKLYLKRSVAGQCTLRIW